MPKAAWIAPLLLAAIVGGVRLVDAQEPPPATETPAPAPAPAEPPAVATPPVEAPPVEAPYAPAPGVSSNVKFFGELLDQRSNATYGDAFRLAYILQRLHAGDAEGSRRLMTFQDYRRALMKAGLIGDTWDQGASDLVTHESAAFLFAKAVEMPGGVLFSLISVERYAHREMMDRSIFPDVNPRQYMSGPEILSAFRATKDFDESRR